MNQKKAVKMTAASSIQKYIASEEISVEYPLTLSSIRNASPEMYDVVPAEKPKRRTGASGAAKKDFENSTFNFWSDLYLRGPSACVKSVLRRFGDQCEIKKIEDYGNGIAQARVGFNWVQAKCVFEIMKENPVLRVTAFAYLGGDNGVVYSESGYTGFTHAKEIDGAKNEGDHWMMEGDVLKDRKYTTFDSRSGMAWREDYRFPYRMLWESNQYTMAENGQTYTISLRGAEAGAQAQDPAVKEEYASQGVKFKIRDSILYAYKGGPHSKIAIPNGVVCIEGGAFADQKDLTGILIPDSVTEIGGSAFSGCTSLTSINIPKKVKNIGMFTFHGCESLTSIDIPKSVKKIERYAFSKCTSLTEINIPDSVKEIEIYAFEECTSLTSVTLPKVVKEMGLSHAFQGCRSLRSIALPSGVKEIGSSAFEGCTNLESIILPSGIKEIGLSAFEGCTSLKSIDIPSGTVKIEYSAFEGCASLTNVVIPNGVTRISYSAFKNCTSLESVVIPEGVKTLEAFSFENCTSLTKLVLPESIRVYNIEALKNCPNVTIYATAGSRAIKFAQKNSIPFVEL